ncbi:MAG: dockerin type I repeat-containing protein [Gemmatimonadota bacterium]|nr:MAG: dockerin type I repeat-containing protein [Gemmatimonadota bacterium]
MVTDIRKKCIPVIVFVTLTTVFTSVQSENVLLKVIGGGGFPGSTGNIVPIYLRNEKPMNGCDFDLVFDTDEIVIRDVMLTHSSRIHALEWSIVDNGVRVAVRSKIFPGSGILANVVFDVNDSSLLDTYPLILSNVVVYPTTLSMSKENGVFSVRNAILAAEWIVSLPGSSERRMSLELMNNISVLGCEFELHFDTDVLTVTDVRSTSVSQWDYEWESAVSGIRVRKIGGAHYLSPISQPIAQIVFQVIEETPYNDYDINIENLALRDSTSGPIASASIDGILTISPAILWVESGRVFIDTSEVNISVELENDVSLIVFVLDLFFNTENLIVKDVLRTERTKDCIISSWSSVERGIRIAFVDCGGPVERRNTSSTLGYIEPGLGSICAIQLDIVEDAPLGEYEFVFSRVELGDPWINIIPVSSENGILKLLVRGDVNIDGKVNVQDVWLTVEIIIGHHQPNSDELLLADCNKDELVNVLDVVCLIHRILSD